MKKIIFIFLTACSFLQTNAQDIDKSFEINKGKLPFPISNVKVVDTLTEDCFGRPSPGLDAIFYSDSLQEVMSIYPGKVVAVFGDSAEKTVMIKSGSYFVIYQGLQDLRIQKGDILTSDFKIGLMAKADRVCSYYISLSLMKVYKNINVNRWLNWRYAHNIGLPKATIH